MQVLLKHGDLLVADSGAAGGEGAAERLAAACAAFKLWVRDTGK